METTSDPQPPATTLQPTPAGMVRIGRSPAISSLRLILASCGIASLLAAVPTAGLFGDVALGYPLAFAGWLAVLAGGISLYFALAYRQVAVDLHAGTARLGRTVVPLSTVTRAWRQTSAAQGSTYLSYRFESTSGAWGRVHVAGGPMKGLSGEELLSLEQFVEASGIAHPDDELSPAQRYLADLASQHGARSRVGKATLLAELRGEPIPDPVEAAGPANAETRRQWERDDADAEVFLRTQASRSRNTRRFFGRLTGAAAVIAFVAIIVAAIAEQVAGGELGSDTNAWLGIVVAGTMALGLCSYLGHCLAAYLDIRGAQRASLAWLRDRDPAQAARGLPIRLLEPFAGRTPGHNLKTLAAFAAAVLGMGGVIAGMVLLLDEELEDLPATVGVGTLASGLVFGVVMTALFVSDRRGTRRQQLLAIRLGGQRLLTEDDPDLD